MSVNYRTLTQKLDLMEKQVKFGMARLVDPRPEDDAHYDAVMEAIEDIRQWMEEA